MRRILDEMFHGSNRGRLRMPDRWNDLLRRPAAAKRLVECDEAVARKSDDLGALLLQGELLPFGIQHVEEIGQPAIVALARNVGRLARRIEGNIQAAQALPVGAIGGVGFVNLLDGDKN